MARPRKNDRMSDDKKRPVGRPSEYSAEIAEIICQKISEGQSLTKICKRNDMPDKSTAIRWLRHFEEFRNQYGVARNLQADVLADETLDIADDDAKDVSIRDGKTVIDFEHIQRSRLRVETRKWMAAKLAPKKYGERVTTEHVDPNDKTINPLAQLLAEIDGTSRGLAPRQSATEQTERGANGFATH
jgi:terminase small subunit-like protein